jgi:ABC-type transporter Mla MlaB component
MADYYTQTVIHQEIPERLIAPFERMLLAQILESDERDGNIYYYASEAPGSFVTLNRVAFQDALSISRVRSRLRTLVAARLAEAGPDHDYFDVDLTGLPYADDAHVILLQDVVRRSKGEIPYLTIAAAYTCNKMRPDAFGGMGIIITPTRILYRSTYDFFQSFEARRARKAARQSAPP